MDLGLAAARALLDEGAALGRVGEPEEFGRMAAVLLSRAASHVTGAAIPIDGGQSRSL